jgi:predicted SAM-dependent methyltransferase
MLTELKSWVRGRVTKAGYQLVAIEHDDQMAYASYPARSLQDRRFYNVGAGSFTHPYWTNIDFYSDWYKANSQQTSGGMIYDLMSLEKIPLESGVAEAMYSSHTIEHISNAAAQNLFNESHRILKKGGIVRLTTPNIDLEYQAWRRGDRSFFYWADYYDRAKNWKRVKYARSLKEESLNQIFLSHFASSVSTTHIDGAAERISDQELEKIFNEMDYEAALDYCTAKCPLEIQKKYPGNHINWWNWTKLERMLKQAGFQSVRLSAYGQSHSAPMRNMGLFDGTHPRISIYVEADK